MSDTTSTAKASPKAPTHIVYHVRDTGEGKKGFWTRIGAAWAQKDGQGFNVQVDCVPLDGRLVIRTASDKQD